MEEAIGLWSRMYQNKPPWLDKETQTMNLPAAIAGELARLITLEIKAELSGSARADALNRPYQQFLKGIRRTLELACAKGGIVFKPFVTRCGISIDVIQADDFIPTDFDTAGNIRGAVFAERINRHGQIFTRLEEHSFEDGVYFIRNTAFKSGSRDQLGRMIPLGTVNEWAGLDEELRIEHIDRPLFAYFKTATVNNIDPSSPLGASVFSRAVELIRDADRQYSRLLWEFEATETAVDVSEDLLWMDENGGYRLPERKKRIYRQLQTSDMDFYKLFNPEIRDSSLINGLEAILRKIEFNCTLAHGTLSHTPEVSKTATEVIASKQRSYSAVADNQRALEQALRDLIYSMDILATLYKLAPPGQLEASFEFDDSVVADRPREFLERMQMAGAQMLRPELVTAWYFGCTEEKALEMMPGYAEGPILGDDFDA